ncbi:MAG: hypothetical protein Q9227_004603 [Pyrenula ochraceoflavens]
MSRHGTAVALKNNFSLTTLLLAGAAIQALLVLILPTRYAVLPSLSLVFLRILDTLLMTLGLTRNRYLDPAILLGKTTYQIPTASGHLPSHPSAEPITLFMLSTRCNHPLGLFAPAFKEVGDHMFRMTRDLALHLDPTTSGFLGQTGWINGGDRDGGNELMNISYWRSPAHVHAYANGPLHTEAWKWFNQVILKERGIDYISISHDLFHVERGNWENVYVNAEPTGMGRTAVLRKAGVEGKGEEDVWVRGVVEARRGALKSSRGRMARRMEEGEGGEGKAEYWGSAMDESE